LTRESKKQISDKTPDKNPRKKNTKTPDEI